MEQGDRCGLFYRHRCLDDQDGTDIQEFHDIDVDHCAILNMAQVDILVGIPDGCFHHEQEDPPINAPPFTPQSTLVDTALFIRDIRPLFVQQIAETNTGGGVEIEADAGMVNMDGRYEQGVKIGPPGTGTTLFVNEIREATNLVGHVPIEFLKTRDIDEYDAGTGIIIRPNTNFLNAINFGPLGGGNYFQYDRTSVVGVTLLPVGVVGTPPPNLNFGTFVFQRFGNTAGGPMVTVYWGNNSQIWSVPLITDIHEYYESAVIIPAAYRPTQTFMYITPSFRQSNPPGVGDAPQSPYTETIKIAYIVFTAAGTIRWHPIDVSGGSGQIRDGFPLNFVQDNGSTVGIRASSTSYECVTS